MAQDITQSLTQITTNTSIKSSFIDPLYLKPDYTHFLRLWYCPPFDDCNIPKFIDLNLPLKIDSPTRTNKKDWALYKQVCLCDTNSCI